VLERLGLLHFSVLASLPEGIFLPDEADDEAEDATDADGDAPGFAADEGEGDGEEETSCSVEDASSWGLDALELSTRCLLLRKLSRLKHVLFLRTEQVPFS
jgi:hypothetical protein